MKKWMTSNDDVLAMLDSLLQEQKRFDWDTFYTDRNRKVPFFADMPDENLVEYMTKGILLNGKVLELGCGPGRNAFYLAGEGFKVDAVDSSEEAINWAKERAEEKGRNINFIKKDIFLLKHEESHYDFVYDSGCFHHIPPHRRSNYLTLIERALKPGLGYSEEKLKAIFGWYAPVEIRLMKDIPAEKGLFGVTGLMTALFQKQESI
jgi:SAM-dependent methyltransferase